MLKQLARALVARTAHHDFVWRSIDSARSAMNVLADFAASVREGDEHPNAQVNAAVSGLPDLVVQHGPFKGMRYPSVSAVGSQFFPKLLGSYERELAAVIERICDRRYELIVDVGCAEGYYAVGLALRIPVARVLAFDTDERAVALCTRMAELNGVSDRVTVGGFCTAETLLRLPLTPATLILSDCEGYEADLFNIDLIPQLASCDVLIETHDFIDPDISVALKTRFALTHDITSIYSVDDVQKAHTYTYPELAGRPSRIRKHLLAEYRPCIMEWLWLTPKA